jgi:hypothetical protein
MTPYTYAKVQGLPFVPSEVEAAALKVLDQN